MTSGGPEYSIQDHHYDTGVRNAFFAALFFFSAVVYRIQVVFFFTMLSFYKQTKQTGEKQTIFLKKKSLINILIFHWPTHCIE